jgi:hypothetical protein
MEQQNKSNIEHFFQAKEEIEKYKISQKQQKLVKILGFAMPACFPELYLHPGEELHAVKK